MSEGPFRVGQEVEVTFRARVAEVGTGRFDQGRSIIRLEGEEVPAGWLSPEDVKSIRIVSSPMPTAPGLYRVIAADAKQANMGEFHTDGYEFHYLNTQGQWSDIGWGFPSSSDAARLEGPSLFPSPLT